MTHGVGVIGAGPGASALHLPTLARLPEVFRVVHVSDAGSGRAAALAARTGARASRGVEELLADPDVEVVAVLGPPDTHASHVLAAVAAGARGVFCEKPLATTREDALAVIGACRAAGTALVVGTNHLFDPAWTRAHHFLRAYRGRVQSVTITAALAPNTRYHALVTEYEPQATPPPRPAPDFANPRIAAGVLRQLMIGLAVHDVPLLRDLAPHVDEVVFARPVPPIGYQIGLRADDVVMQLTAVMVPGGPDTLWRITVGTSVDRLDVEFPPPFVHAGSAAVTVRGADGRQTTFPREGDDGYLAAWEALRHLLEGGGGVEYDDLLADALYAIDLADAVADRVLAEESA